jgi:hypothetical protein
MTVILENRKLDASKSIKLPRPMGFAAMAKAVRAIEPDRAWEIVESF